MSKKRKLEEWKRREEELTTSMDRNLTADLGKIMFIAGELEGIKDSIMEHAGYCDLELVVSEMRELFEKRGAMGQLVDNLSNSEARKKVATAVEIINMDILDELTARLRSTLAEKCSCKFYGNGDDFPWDDEESKSSAERRKDALRRIEDRMIDEADKAIDFGDDDGKGFFPHIIK